MWKTTPIALLAFLIASPASADSLRGTTNIRWTGDMRYRFTTVKESVDEDRPFQQIRVRLGLKAQIQDDLTATLRLATATSAISSNQTLGDSKEPGMTRRSFGLDLAYSDWTFLDNGHLLVGRVPNPYFAPGKTQLIFDSDIAFEGISLNWNPKWSDSTAFAHLGGFIISENYNSPEDAVDTGIVGLEIGYSMSTAYGTWTVHAARFHYLNIVDRQITTVEKSAKVDSYSYPYDRVRGNTVYVNDPLAAAADRKYFYKYDFVQSNTGLEWKWTAADTMDVLAYFDWIANERAGSDANATEVGLSVRFGRAKIEYAISKKQSDSVVGAFTDSDFNGGGTDARGSKISVNYQLTDNSSFTATHFSATRGMDSISRDYISRQFDFALQF